MIQSVWQKSFDFFGKPVVVRPSEAELTSDAGLLPIHQFDQRIGLTEQFAAPRGTGGRRRSGILGGPTARRLSRRTDRSAGRQRLRSSGNVRRV